jgi:uncharacterized protein
MHTKWLEKEISYDGSQLKPLFNYLEHGILGDSIVSWRGPCNVTNEHMIDGEDLRANAIIASDQMLHFVIELFQFPLSSAIALQRLLGEILILKIKEMGDSKADFKRFGDDVYNGKRKLNISIATCSVTSSLIHYGINIKNDGTPVETCSLNDFNINEISEFAQSFMDACKAEVLSIKRAMVKVRSF